MYREALCHQVAINKASTLASDASMGKAAISVGSALGAYYSLEYVPPPAVTEKVYLVTIRSADEEMSAAAAIGFGTMQEALANDIALNDPSRLDQAAAAFQIAFDTGHPEYAPIAAHELAGFSESRRKPE